MVSRRIVGTKTLSADSERSAGERAREENDLFFYFNKKTPQANICLRSVLLRVNLFLVSIQFIPMQYFANVYVAINDHSFTVVALIFWLVF